MPYLTKLVEHVNVSISVPALRTIGNVVSSDQAEIARPAIDAGVIPLLAALLDHQKQILRKESAWTLANILAESAENVNMCLMQGIIDNLIHHLQHDVDPVRKECVWALANSIEKSNSEGCSAIVDKGLFTALNYALELKDQRIVHVALEAINKTLKKGQSLPLVDGENPFVLDVERCGLLDKIEEL